MMLWPTIERLLFHSRPPTVVRGVRAVVVLAIQCQTERPLAHIGEEVFELKPAFANRDPAPSVARPAFVAHLVAADAHGPPGKPCARSAHPMSGLRGGHPFALKATARLSFTNLQPVSVGDDFAPAVAAAKPASAL